MTYKGFLVYNIPVKLAVLIILLMAACGGTEPTLTLTQSPTPTSPPTATAEGDPETNQSPTSTPRPTATAKGAFKTLQYTQSPAMTIDLEKEYVATLNTNKGAIVIELLAQEAPKTVNNFVFLAREGFYDGIIFHRVIQSFMIQGGDPTGTGTGGPGYRFEDEFVPSLVFDRPGILAMANSGPSTNGSQFFITTVPTPHLSGRHTIFGRVIQGQDVADAISMLPADARDKPREDVVIEGVEIKET